jgi:general secretion pathway protein G
MSATVAHALARAASPLMATPGTGSGAGSCREESRHGTHECVRYTVKEREMTTRRRAEAGVTLIEMLVVVTIIALFATLVAPNMFKQVDKSNAVAARAQINSFQSALMQYKLSTGTFPTTEQGLEALRTRPANVNFWEGPYLDKEVPLDPWKRAYVYRFPGEHGDTPDILSYGGDGQPGGEGVNADIVSWKN